MELNGKTNDSSIRGGHLITIQVYEWFCVIHVFKGGFVKKGIFRGGFLKFTHYTFRIYANFDDAPLHPESERGLDCVNKTTEK